MDHLEHCDLLEGEVERFAALVEAAPRSMSVPSCPGWTVDDLAHHLGTVHRWAEQLVRVRAPTRVASSEMGLEEGPVDGEWVRRGRRWSCTGASRWPAPTSTSKAHATSSTSGSRTRPLSDREGLVLARNVG